MLAKERQTAYYGSFTSGGIDALPDNTHLMGDARLDRDFGVQLDGDGAYVSLDTSWRTTSYASDGTFAIALWFTKGSACLAGLGSNSFATLFSHMQVPDDESKTATVSAAPVITPVMAPMAPVYDKIELQRLLGNA